MKRFLYWFLLVVAIFVLGAGGSYLLPQSSPSDAESERVKLCPRPDVDTIVECFGDDLKDCGELASAKGATLGFGRG